MGEPARERFRVRRPSDNVLTRCYADEDCIPVAIQQRYGVLAEKPLEADELCDWLPVVADEFERV